MKYLIFICSFTLFFHSDIKPQSNKTEIQKNIDSQKEKFEKIAKSIWTWAEVGYQEEKSTALLKKTLSDEGFDIRSGVAEIPTAFVAEYGSGFPVIGILAEFDACLLYTSPSPRDNR